MRTAHQHSGYLTVAVSLVYITWSLATIASMPKAASPDHRQCRAVARAGIRKARSKVNRS